MVGRKLAALADMYTPSSFSAFTTTATVTLDYGPLYNCDNVQLFIINRRGRKQERVDEVQKEAFVCDNSKSKRSNKSPPCSVNTPPIDRMLKTSYILVLSLCCLLMFSVIKKWLT